jgi:glycosyltransferase involved in cell wall biosynthesis
MTEPAFSVVIPAYNQEDLVGWALKSVQRQTRPDWEAIVVDDGSTDDTADTVRGLAEADQRIRLITKENRGSSAARNAGIAVSRAPLISFLDSDDMLLPRYLEVMGSALAATPGAGLAYTDAWALDVDRGRFRRATAMSGSRPPDVAPDNPVEVMKLLVHLNFIWISSTLTRRALEDAGPFREDLLFAEDAELWFRVLACGYRAVRPPGILGVKRERAEAKSQEHVRNIGGFQAVLRGVSEDPEMPAEVRELADARIRTLEWQRRAFSGESRLLSVGLATRLRLGRFKRAVLPSREWRETPAAVKEAFPDLQGI